MKTETNASLLINPFTRIAGTKALLIGLAVFIISILIGNFGGLIFDGVLDAHIGGQFTLTQAFLYPSMGVVILIAMLYLSGYLLTKSSIRLIDVAGTVIFAKSPYLLIALAALVPGVKEASIKIANAAMSMNMQSVTAADGIYMAVFTFVSIVATIWFIVWAYKAFSVSCNVKGIKAIIAFTVSLILAEVVTLFIIMSVR